MNNDEAKGCALRGCGCFLVALALLLATATLFILLLFGATWLTANAVAGK